MGFENLKPFAIRLAHLHSGNEGAATLRAMLGAMTELLPKAVQKAPPESDIKQIGIWKLEGDEWIRQESMREEWDLWAPIERISLRSKAKRRLVFLGESAAKGFLYEPSFSPAIALQSILKSETCFSDIEVLDLCRTSQQIHELQEMLENIELLKPDMLVVFAGNNWSIGPNVLDRDRIRSLLENGVSVSDILNMCRELQGDEAFDFAIKLGQLRDALQIPLVYVIPEFNLSDWRTQKDLLVAPWLGGNANVAWREARRKAEEALKAGRPAIAKKNANAMLELDGGSSAVTFEILAATAKISKRPVEERSFLEGARDAGVLQPEAWSPRCLSVVRRKLREGFQQTGIRFVDLGDLFSGQDHHSLPGRNYFMDYCHLNSSGIALAMAGVVRELTEALNQPIGLDIHALQSQVVMPSNEVESIAYFLSAIHSAHWGQDRETLAWNCDHAVRLSPIGKELMRLYNDYKSRGLPDDATESFDQMLQMAEQIKPLFLRPKNQIKMKDYVLLEEMRRAAGIECSTQPRSQQVSKNTQRKLELARPTHYLSAYSSLEHCLNRKYKHGLFRSYNPVSRFRFWPEEVPAGKKKSIDLILSVRVPHANHFAQVVRISVNGKIVRTVKVAGRWKKFKFSIERSGLLNKGRANEIEIYWPEGASPEQDVVWAEIYSELDRYGEASFFPAFGEVFSLSIEGDI